MRVKIFYSSFSKKKGLNKQKRSNIITLCKHVRLSIRKYIALDFFTAGVRNATIISNEDTKKCAWWKENASLSRINGLLHF